MIPFEKIIQTAMHYGADFTEVFVEDTRQTTLVCDDRRIEQVAQVTDRGVGIRVMKDTHTAYASTNDLTQSGLLSLASEAGRILASRRIKTGPLLIRERQATKITGVRQHPFGITLDDKCSIVKRANEVAWKAGGAIRQVRVSYRDTVRRIELATSEGNYASDEQVDTVFAVHVVAADGSLLQTGFEPIAGAKGFEIFDQTPPEEIALRAATRALKMLKARPAPVGQMPVILASEAGGTMIHEAVGHGLEADLAGEGLSVYSGKIGAKVAMDSMSVADDALLTGRRGSFTFDDEGTPAQRTILIEGGVLKSYLHTRQTALKTGASPTGNGRRQSYEYPPVVRMTNTFIMSGQDDPSDILKGTASGLFVQRMGGGQVNTINGDFVFEVQEGYLIEGGRLGEMVRGATLVGNGPNVLAQIDRVGNDLGFSVGTCGKEGQEVPVSGGQPTIRIPLLTVGGTKIV